MLFFILQNELLIYLLNCMMQWVLMTLLDPPCSLANLIYIGYSGNPAAALRVTRRRAVDRKKQATERNVFQCYVFGSKNAGKSALLDSLLGRCASEPITIVSKCISSSPTVYICLASKKQLTPIFFTGLSQTIILQQQLRGLQQIPLN